MKQPTDRRGGGKLAAPLHRLSRRERIAALALAVVLLLLLAVGVGSAVGGGLPFVGDDEEARASGVPSDWTGLEPLLPLAPSLKDMAALKSSAAGGDSGVLAAESGAGGGGGALRVRALPDVAGGGAQVATVRTPRGRPRPAAVGAPARRKVRVPLVRRILATRVRIDLGIVNNLREIIEDDLRNLTGLPIDLDFASLPGIGGGRGPLTLTVVDSQADSRFDILLVARGGRLLEAYRFRDRDIAGLAAQINLRSRVLVADLLRDGRRLARVTAAPLRSATSGPGSGLLGTGLAADASRGGPGIGAGAASLANARSGAQGRPHSSRGGPRSGSRSAGGGSSSPSLSRGSSSSSGAGRSIPRRSTARFTPARSRGSSPSPKFKKPKPRERGGHPKSSRPSRGKRSSGHGNGHGNGHGKSRGKGHEKHDHNDD